jgi:uncharacterized protein YqgV (UPF0045/DUF77 family)
MSHLVNLGIQWIPLVWVEQGFPLVDEAIARIRLWGHPMVVTPFETVLECDAESVGTLVDELVHWVNQACAGQWLLQVRIHGQANRDITMGSKTDHHA